MCVQRSSTPTALASFNFFFSILLTKNAFENEWKARTVLPGPSRTSPPPTSAQKVHGQLANQNQQPQAQSVVTPVPPVALASPVNSAPQQQPSLTTTLTAAAAATPSSPAVDPPAPATPQPKQMISTSAQQQQPSSPPRMSSPDMDVDVGGTPEPDDMARDGESDLVVQQLERGLPRWEGLGDFGWLKEMEGSEDRRLELVLAIKGHKDAVYVSLLPLPPLILMSLQWQSLCNCARGHARGNQCPLLVIQRMSWPLCYSVVGTVCLTLLFQTPLSLKLIEVIEALHIPQLFLLMSGVEPCAF